MLIFGIGGGVSIYEGVLHIREPEAIDEPFWNYVVLGSAALFESASLAIALRQFNRERRGQPFWQALHASKDPSTYTVLAEDGAALAGLSIAALGIWASVAFEMPVLDGAASVLIGLLLCGVAVLLVQESRGLLVGEGVRPDTARQIRALVESRSEVRGATLPLSMYIGPEEVLLTMDAAFEPTLTAAQTADVIAAIENEIRARFPRITRIYIEAAVQHGAGVRTAASPSPGNRS